MRCLFLNVFRGANASEEAAVAIFVHGGAYKTGSSNLYPAGELVDYWGGRSMVVTVSYRLNVLGFLGAEQLRF